MVTPTTRLPLMLTAVAIATANFMNILDTTIAVVALPGVSCYYTPPQRVDM